MKGLLRVDTDAVKVLEAFFGKNYNRNDLGFSDSPIEVALFRGDREISYPGYKRVKIPRNRYHFSIKVETDGVRIYLKEHADFPMCENTTRIRDHICAKICGHSAPTESPVVANGFGMYIDNILILQGDLIPEIRINEGVVPRLMNTSRIGFDA